MDPNRFPSAVARLSATDLQGESILALDCAALLGADGPLPLYGVHHAGFAELDAAALASHAPSLIILPLFVASYDAAHAVELLESLGYAGRIAVLAPHLPRPGLVEQELRGLGPGERLILISP